jgi:hypothetical protein
VTAAGPALKRILEVFEKHGIACFAGGSLASSVHGIPRATRDLGLIVRLEPSQIQPLIREIKPEFYADPETILDALAARRSFNLIHFASGYKFDIFPVTDEPFECEEFRRREFQAAPQLGEGVLLPVASAEDVILAKLVWFEKGGGVSERQWADARGVVEVQSSRLDVGYMRNWAARPGVQNLLERLLAHVRAQ